MHSSPNENRESFDAERVETALKAINSGDFEKAESILLDVIENTSLDYSNTKEVDDVISIKFWDQAAFFHYIAWH
jgi:hypothetical protein